MFKSTRIAAVLAFSFICVPAHALSMKEYEAKSDADKLRYLQTCVGNLIIDVAKTDRPLSLKIRSYYYDKLPGYPYPEGTYDLLDRIGKLEQQADKDKSVDLSKTSVEELVVLTTAAKFKILPDFQRQADPPVSPRPAVPVPAPPPVPAPRPAAPVDDDPIGPGASSSRRRTNPCNFACRRTWSRHGRIRRLTPKWRRSGCSSHTMALIRAKPGISSGSRATPSTPLSAPGGLRLPIPRFQMYLSMSSERGNAARRETGPTTCISRRPRLKSEIVLIPAAVFAAVPSTLR